LIRADLHIHTKYSLDSTISPKSLVDQLCAHATVTVVAVTDHNTVEGYTKVRELASAFPDVLVIPGIEVGTPLGDLILLGVEEKPPRSLGVDELVRFAKERGGVVVVPHPYREFGLGGATRHYAVDAIETLNGNASPQVNRLAQDLATELGLPGVAGSDAHNVDELWAVYNEIQASLDVDAILGAIKKGLVRVFCSRKSISF
jgi:predicted metal-dependent phosphoesterase TrpH